MRAPIKCTKCHLVEMLEVDRSEVHLADTYVCPDCALETEPPEFSEPRPLGELEAKHTPYIL